MSDNNKFAIYTEGFAEGESFKLVSCFHTIGEAQALVKVGQVIVMQTGQDWPKDTMTESEITDHIYKRETDMTNETTSKTNDETTSEAKAEKRILTIMDTLIYLRIQTDKLSMKKAGLLVEVKDGKLYKDDFGNFGAFCDAIGYHRSTVCTLIDCYRIPQLRENYPAIGARAGKMLVQASNSSMPEDQVSDLITFASGNKSGVACQHITDKMREHFKAVFAEGADEDQDHIESLPMALVRHASLIKRRKALVEELTQLDDMIKSVGKYIEKLSSEESEENDD